MNSFMVWLGESKQIATDLADVVMGNVPKTHKMIRFQKTGSLKHKNAYLVHTQGPGEDAPLVAHYVSYKDGKYKYMGNSL